jgi:hypothetical protein
MMRLYDVVRESFVGSAGMGIELEESDRTEDYRPVSGMAVAALLVGGLSIVASYSPLLWGIPVVGAALAAVALRELSAPDAVKVGRLAAILGLALSLGLGTQAVTRHMLGNWLTQRRAVEVVERWVTAIREDRLMQARSMLTPMLRPPAEMVGSEDNPKPVNDPLAEEEGFRHSPAVAAVRGCGSQAVARCEFDHYDEESQERKRAWHVRVRLKPCDDGREVVLRLEVDMKFEQQKLVWGEHWEITAVSLGDSNST